MAREVFVAMFPNLATAEAARFDLERAGIAATDIELGARGAPRMSPSEIWDWLFSREPAYRRHVEDGRALLAVRADGDDYDRIASLLLRHDLLARGDLLPDRTSESPRVRRYALEGAERASLNS